MSWLESPRAINVPEATNSLSSAATASTRAAEGTGIIAHRKVVRTPAAAMLTDSEAPSWNHGSTGSFSGFESTITHRVVGAWVRPEAQIEAQMQQLEARTQADIQRLTAAVDGVRRMVNALAAGVASQGGEVPVLHVSSAELETADAAGLADILTAIADEAAITDEGTVEFSVQALQHEDAAVRAAAGRALSLLAPDRAREVLPAIIEGEANRFAASVLRSALRAAVA